MVLFFSEWTQTLEIEADTEVFRYKFSQGISYANVQSLKVHIDTIKLLGTKFESVPGCVPFL